MDNYIVINGKKTELTDEQLKALGIEVTKKRNNPFNNSKLKDMDIFYVVGSVGVFEQYYSSSSIENDIKLDNNFNDKDFANQVYLHELLNLKLLKYAWDNEGEDTEWNSNTLHYYILFDSKDCLFTVNGNRRMKNQNIYFSKRYVAEQAIKDVIEPFMKEHPEFVW